VWYTASLLHVPALARSGHGACTSHGNPLAQEGKEMRNRITALALAVALGLSAAHAQPRDDADENTLDETVSDASVASVEEAVRAAEVEGARDAQDAQASADARTDTASEEAEVVAKGDDKGAPVDVDAKAIEAAVRASLNMSTPIEAGQIDVNARDDGTVTLRGTVPSEAQKKLVETVASNSPAVRELRSRLVVREPGQPPPETPVEN